MFVGFQDDTPSSVIFQATEQLKNEVYYSFEKQPKAWKEAVFHRSCEIFLQMVSPDALVRLQLSRLADSQQELYNIYFSKQCHDSVLQFLRYHLQNTAFEGIGSLLMQVNSFLFRNSSVHVYFQPARHVKSPDNLIKIFAHAGDNSKPFIVKH